MKAIVIGATGAVGKDLVEELLSRREYEKIITFTRRPLDIKSEKIESYIIDFDRPSDWVHLVKGDVLFSALGTSLKQAGSKEAQYRIDHDYQLSFAKAARENGVPCGAGVLFRRQPVFFHFLLKAQRPHRKGCGSSSISAALHPPSPFPYPEACQKAGGNGFGETVPAGQCPGPLQNHGPRAYGIGGTENGGFRT